MCRLLVTGAAGFAGHHFVEHVLETTDWTMVALDGLQYAGRQDRITDIDSFDPDRVVILHHDLGAPIHPWLDDRLGPIDAVVHLASQTHVDRSIDTPVPFVVNNVAATLHLMEWARHRDLTHFVQVSTDEVYGSPPAGVSSREWDPIVPSNPYAASKAAQEAIAISYWRTFAVPVVITNTMNLIGERQHPEKFLPKTVGAVLAGDTVTVHAQRDDDGWQPSQRHWLHARNHADALCWVLNRKPTVWSSASTQRPDRWNVAGEERDVLAMASRIAEIAGRPLNYEFVDYHSSRPGHDHRYALDDSKLRAAGWTPPLSLDDSLQRTVRWMIDHPNW